MAAPLDNPSLNVLQRLDLALAERLAGQDPSAMDDLSRGNAFGSPPVDIDRFVAGMLGLRGLGVTPEEVHTIRVGGTTRFGPEHHEYLLVQGMARVHARVTATPTMVWNGWILVDLFQTFTEGIPRFRNNALRRDLPWDAILFVDYPNCDRVSGCLDGFQRSNCFTDLRARFENLHPVRQAFRVFWLLARIAPFPDFNLAMAWIAMCLHLADSGYPMLLPEREDRERVHRLIGGPVPLRILSFETRLLRTIDAAG